MRSLFALLIVAANLCLACSAGAQEERPPADKYQEQLPWDYKPYEVLIWIAGVDETTLNESLGRSLQAYLDRDFASLWNTQIVAAPSGMSAIAARNFEQIDFGSLTSEDPVVVIKRDHPEAARIRFQGDVATHIDAILAAEVHVEKVIRQGTIAENATLHGMTEKIKREPTDLLNLRTRWADPTTEAMLLPRGMTVGLEPTPKIMEIEVAERMGDVFAEYDKVFLVYLEGNNAQQRLAVREIDCLMRHPGPVIEATVTSPSQLPQLMALAIRNAFSPIVRIDDVGMKTVQGSLRGAGLIASEDSPANVQEGDFLQPLLRKDDRTGQPSTVGIVDWTYLLVTDKDERDNLEMKIHTGRDGALSGRRTNRTHRMALKVRPFFPHTILRLHAKGDPQQPLAGYDVFDRDLETDKFTKIGQTDWDGRLLIEKTDVAMRRLYVKNGLLVLARLPMVPGQTEMESADLVGDDIRLQAEAYIRGVQNSIIDLVAIRKLLAANIRQQIKQGNTARATELLNQLRKQPSYEKLADDMAQRQTEIISSNRSEQAKIDSLFGETRDLLVKHINQSLINVLDREVNAALGRAVGDAPLPGQADSEPTGDATGQ
ncbi:hypothetical protein SH139x_000939 [Planctomycetaceae bacterium SH139]